MERIGGGLDGLADIGISKHLSRHGIRPVAILNVKWDAQAGRGAIWIDLLQHPRVDAALVENVDGMIGDSVDTIAPEAANLDM